MTNSVRRSTAHGRGSRSGAFAPGRLAAMDVTREVAIYDVDAIVRRSAPLQATVDGSGRSGVRA
ncbi:MAG: hypothetical protein IPJ97_09995 [Proteobacteria bacterium]|nr:hypothetical protein [Pseudomonadota bacterium]